MQGKRTPGRPKEKMSVKPIAQKVVALKMKGLSFSQIGRKLGISKQRAHQVYIRVHNELLRAKAA